MTYGLYVLGAIVLIGGVIYGAVLLHVPTPWIVVLTLVMLGGALLSGVKATRQKDLSH